LTLTLNASATSWSFRAGAPGEASVINRTRACVSFRAAALPTDTNLVSSARSFASSVTTYFLAMPASVPLRSHRQLRSHHSPDFARLTKY
jgi:hypothetical protein